MAKNSLFAILLRSSWWISAAIGALLVAVAFAFLPKDFKLVGAVSAVPFFVIAGIAVRRQWRAPSAARVELTVQATAAMAWPAFADLLEQAFTRDRFASRRSSGGAADFVLERGGRRMLVGAKRWKSARIGHEQLRALQAERQADDVQDALYIGLGELSDAARTFAAEHGITVWQAAELAQALQDLPLKAPGTSKPR